MSEPNDKNGAVDGDEKKASSRPPADETKPAEAEAPPPPADPLEQARAEAAKHKENWMRSAADFDNFRKRARRELEDARKGGREELLKELLPVFDNLERAVQSAQAATDPKAVANGLAMVLRQFADSLGRIGIQKVPSVGKQFDPGVHEAIQQVETDEHPPGTIVAEVQPGYVQGDRLVRAAMVVVAKPKPKTDDAERGDG
ncbi:MAG TPA: nucleotide exchange factor GrpE [Labilithrix sp.]